MSKDATTKAGKKHRNKTKGSPANGDEPPISLDGLDLDRLAFGVDIGGSGIKAAPVDLVTGELARPRFKIKTPQPATPDAVVQVIKRLIDHYQLPETVPVGVTFPGVILGGKIATSANLDKEFIGVDLSELLAGVAGRGAFVVNDADAAGYAEVVYGAARGVAGTVLVMTLGTGIGSALIRHGELVPNTELGHLEIDGHDAESRAASSARDREDLSWKAWAKRLQRYFTVVDRLLWPDLFVIGGGVSREHEKFLPRLDLRAPIIPAQLRNQAGIVGVAYLAAKAAGRDVEVHVADGGPSDGVNVAPGGDLEGEAGSAAPAGPLGPVSETTPAPAPVTASVTAAPAGE